MNTAGVKKHLSHSIVSFSSLCYHPVITRSERTNNIGEEADWELYSVLNGSHPNFRSFVNILKPTKNSWSLGLEYLLARTKPYPKRIRSGKQTSGCFILFGIYLYLFHTSRVSLEIFSVYFFHILDKQTFWVKLTCISFDRGQKILGEMASDTNEDFTLFTDNWILDIL